MFIFCQVLELQAFLHRVGLPELIATDFDDYVRIAVKVVTDQEYQKSLRQKLQITKQNLFNQKARYGLLS